MYRRPTVDGVSRHPPTAGRRCAPKALGDAAMRGLSAPSSTELRRGDRSEETRPTRTFRSHRTHVHSRTQTRGPHDQPLPFRQRPRRHRRLPARRSAARRQPQGPEGRRQDRRLLDRLPDHRGCRRGVQRIRSEGARHRRRQWNRRRLQALRRRRDRHRRRLASDQEERVRHGREGQGRLHRGPRRLRRTHHRREPEEHLVHLAHRGAGEEDLQRLGQRQDLEGRRSLVAGHPDQGLLAGHRLGNLRLFQGSGRRQGRRDPQRHERLRG